MTIRDLEVGKIYFIAYGENTQILVRFKDKDSMRLNYFDHLHYWNGFENFRQEGYSVTSGITEIREATKPEKHLLFRHEIENNCV